MRLRYFFLFLLTAYFTYAIYINWDYLWFNTAKIEIKSCDLHRTQQLFLGLRPDISYLEARLIAGEEDDRKIIEVDEEGVDLYYFTDKGKIILYWSGKEIDPIGMIEIKLKNRISIFDMFPKNVLPSMPPPILKKKRIKIYCMGQHYLTLIMSKMKIESIEYWNN